MTPNDSRPIGVFDSGAGGLTVLKELLHHFPRESFIYLGDTARLPYGSKSPETIQKYSQQVMAHLQTMDVKAIVIACNSASTIYRNKTHFKSVPIYNVITPGAEKAVHVSENMNIGVVGTNATINSQAYTKAITMLTPAAKVFSVACPLWVPLAEEGWREDPITNLIVYRYLEPLISQGIDTLILGCTHYSLLKTAIKKVTTHKIALIDSGQAICHWIKKDMDRQTLHPNQQGAQGVEIHLTDISPQFCHLARHLLGEEFSENILPIDL